MVIKLKGIKGEVKVVKGKSSISVSVETEFCGRLVAIGKENSYGIRGKRTIRRTITLKGVKGTIRRIK